MPTLIVGKSLWLIRLDGQDAQATLHGRDARATEGEGLGVRACTGVPPVLLRERGKGDEGFSLGSTRQRGEPAGEGQERGKIRGVERQLNSRGVPLLGGVQAVRWYKERER